MLKQIAALLRRKPEPVAVAIDAAEAPIKKPIVKKPAAKKAVPAKKPVEKKPVAKKSTPKSTAKK